MENLICPYCKLPISENFLFCSNCGKKLKDAFSTTIGKQIGIYTLSILLPPLGLVPGIKYLLQKDQKRKLIGITAIVLTIISTIITVWFTIGYVSQASNTINSQLQQIQTGY